MNCFYSLLSRIIDGSSFNHHHNPFFFPIATPFLIPLISFHDVFPFLSSLRIFSSTYILDRINWLRIRVVGLNKGIDLWTGTDRAQFWRIIHSKHLIESWGRLRRQFVSLQKQTKLTWSESENRSQNRSIHIATTKTRRYYITAEIHFSFEHYFVHCVYHVHHMELKRENASFIDHFGHSS